MQIIRYARVNLQPTTAPECFHQGQHEVEREIPGKPGRGRLLPGDLEDQFRRYVASALELRGEFEGRLELLIGFETEALPVADWPEKMRAIRRSAPFDYIVGSVHSIGDTWIDLNVETSERAARENGGWEALRCSYFDRLAELVQTLRPEVVGHVDLIRRFEKHQPLIGHVQIAAVPSRHEPDEGEVNYPEIFAALDRLGYEGYVAGEYRPRGRTEDGLGWAARYGVSPRR